MSKRNGEQAAETGHWSWREVDVGAFKDARLGRRFGDLLRRLSEGMGGSIPFACQDWTNTKAAYSFFSNPRVKEGDILKGHFAATRGRCEESDSCKTLRSSPKSAAIRMRLASPKASTVVVTKMGGFDNTRFVAS